MKILSIGNSYSDDMQTYVHQMAAAAGADITVINAYVGACSMELHAGFYRDDSPVYTGYQNGTMLRENMTLRDFLRMDQFDYVTLQSGTAKWEQYGKIPDNQPYIQELIAAIREYQPQAEPVYNEFWADGIDSPRDVLRQLFDGDRNRMGQLYHDMAVEARDVVGIRYILPCGQAFERAYTTFSTKLQRDGYHCSERGRYLMACVWLNFFTGLPVPLSYIPAGHSYEYGNNPEVPDEAERALLIQAARDTVSQQTVTPARLNGNNGNENK